MASTLSLFTELIRFNYLAEPGDHAIPPHIHHFHQLDVILAGSVSVELEHQRFRLGPGDAMLVPPLVRHGYRTHRGFRQGSFKFVLAPWCWSLFGNSARCLKIERPLRHSIEIAGARYAAQSPLGLPNALAVATLCLSEFLEDADLPLTAGTELDTFRQRLWPMLEEIENSPNATWSVTRMATQCYLSPDYFSHCFREVVGQSPYHYLIEARMRAAASALLAEPPQPIKQIAEQSGYAAVHSFTHAFTKLFGVSPGAYRRDFKRTQRY